MNRPAPAETWSLTVRLGWRLAAVMVLAMLLAGAAIAWRAIKTVHDLDDLALQSQARLIVAWLAPGPDEAVPAPLPEDLVARFRASDGDNVFAVYAAGRLVATSDAAAIARVAPLLPLPLSPGLFRVPALAGHEYGFLGLTVDAGRFRVVVLQGREQSGILLDSLTGGFWLAAVWLLLPIGVGMIVVGVATLRQGLRPLRLVSEAAGLVGPTRPGARLPVDTLPEELARLVYAMNDALERLEHALLAQRRFVAEAAHALRTPLAVLTARLDLLDDQPGVDALRHDADRMARLVGQLLRMARLEGLPLDVTQPVDLHAVAVEAIADLVPLGLQRDVEIALGEAVRLAPVRGNQAALVLALTNLIENALSHAPSGSTVEIVLAAPATIEVLDRGPGVAAEHRARIFGRFERGPTAPEGGAGLGLAIVAGIAAAHGGTVRAMERPGGGGAFVLTLGPGWVAVARQAMQDLATSRASG